MFPFVGPTFECITDSGNFKLGDIKVSGMKGDDYLYVLDTDHATPDNSTKIVYVDATAAATKWGLDYGSDDYLKWVGWWKSPLHDYPDDENEDIPGKTYIETDFLNKDTDIWSAGESFIGYFPNKQSIVISFPKAVPDKE